jgi:uncharacterized RDD family membrane protein YckC
MTKYYAGFWPRAVAALIDTVIMLGISMGINKLLGVASFPSATQAAPSSDMIFSALFSMCCGFLYYSIIQGIMKGSIGKHAMGLTLVDAKNFKQISIGQSVGRYMMSFISYFIFGAGIFSIIWNKKKQGWHDKTAGTVVVKKKSLKQLMAPKIKKPVTPKAAPLKAA